MKCLVLYDTSYGNTAKVGQSIAEGIGAHAAEIETVDRADLRDFDLLIVGSPTQGGQPTKSMTDWLAGIEPGALAGIKVAAFDTRLSGADVNIGLKLLMGLIGYAGPRIEKALASRGGVVVTTAEGFIVTGKEGPLRRGELERASLWGRTLSKLVGQAVPV